MRQPQRFDQALQVWALLTRQPGSAQSRYARLATMLQQALAVDTAPVAAAALAAGAQGPAIGAAIRAARIAQLERMAGASRNLQQP